MTNEQQQVIGLAAAAQSLALVNEVAFNGNCDRQLSETVLDALLVYSPNEVIEAYGNNVHNLSYGFSVLSKMLSNQIGSELIKYLIPAMVIELKLVRNGQLLNSVRADLRQTSNMINQSRNEIANLYSNNSESSTQSNSNLSNDSSDNDGDDIDLDNDSYLNIGSNYLIDNKDHMRAIASAYKRSISSIEPRIMIKGNSQYLQEEQYANQIRSLLFASLRGISFYRHNGGSRVGLVTSKRRILSIIKDFK